MNKVWIVRTIIGADPESSCRISFYHCLIACATLGNVMLHHDGEIHQVDFVSALPE